jgi:hypothetical protein
MDDVNLPPADARIKSILNFMGSRYDEMLAYTGPGHWADPDMLLLGSKLTAKYPISLSVIVVFGYFSCTFVESRWSH